MRLDGLKRQVLRLALSLPGPILRLVSGGSATVRMGRTLSPAFQALAYHVGPGSQVPDDSESAPSSLAARFDPLLAAASMPTEVIIDRIATGAGQGPGGQLLRPKSVDEGAPILVLLHSGQRATGDMSTLMPFAGQLARRLGLRVFMPEFRGPPTHPFPIGLQDVASAWTWAKQQSSFDTRLPMVAGIGLGANLATVLCQDLKTSNEPMPSLQLLINPLTDLSRELETRRFQDQDWPLGQSDLSLQIGQYVPPGIDPSSPRLSPLLCEDLSGLPPTIVVTSGFDPLYEEGEAYARKLVSAGNRVRYLCFEHLVQGFVVYGGAVREAHDAAQSVIEAVADMLETIADARPGQ